MYTNDQLTPHVADRYRAQVVDRLTSYNPNARSRVGKEASTLYALTTDATYTALKRLLSMPRPEVEALGLEQRALRLTRRSLHAQGPGTRKTMSVASLPPRRTTPRAAMSDEGGYMSVHCRGRHAVDPKPVKISRSTFTH